MIADRRGGSVLVVLGAEESAAAKSFRNLAGVSVIPTEACGVADLVGARDAARLRGRAQHADRAGEEARRPHRQAREEVAA